MPLRWSPWRSRSRCNRPVVGADRIHPETSRSRMRETWRCRVKAIDPGLVLVRGAASRDLRPWSTTISTVRAAALEAALAKQPKLPGCLQQPCTLLSANGRTGTCHPVAQASLVPVSQGQGNHFRQSWPGLPGAGGQRCRDRLAAQDRRPEYGDLWTPTRGSPWSGYSNKGDTRNAARYAAEYRKRASAQGVKGIESNAPLPGSPPAVLKYYQDRLCPEWKKAGLP